MHQIFYSAVVKIIKKKNPESFQNQGFLLELLIGIEPMTSSLPWKRSTDWAIRAYGADDGNRTRVVSLGSWNSAIELHPQKKQNAFSLAWTLYKHFAHLSIHFAIKAKKWGIMKNGGKGIKGVKREREARKIKYWHNKYLKLY